MNISGLLDTFSELVAIDSPSLGERELCDYLKRRLSNMGINYLEDDAGSKVGGNCGNLYAFIEGEAEREPLLLCAHMDTIEPSRGKKAVFHADGRVSSEGGTVLGADDLGGVAAILEALRVIKGESISHRPIELLFSVAEERYGMGAGVFDFTGINSREAYVPDLEGCAGLAAYKAPTIISFTARFIGRSSHAGFAPEAGIHAVLAASRAVCAVEMGRLGDGTTCNIGVIEGGAASNIVPSQCVLKGEIRGFSHSGALDRMELVKLELEGAAASTGASVEVESRCEIEAYETPLSHRVVKRFERACAELGIPCTLEPTFGGSDNNHLAKHGITGIVIGSEMRRCHSVDEYTTTDGLNMLANLILELIRSEI